MTQAHFSIPDYDTVRCTVCGQYKPRDEFPEEPRNRSGIRHQCKQCRNAQVKARLDANPAKRAEQSRRGYVRYVQNVPVHIRREDSRRRRWRHRYGVEESEVQTMIDAQGRRCAICRTDEPMGNGDRFQVDHCHACEEAGLGIVIRGMLCFNCNTGGNWDKIPDWPALAAAYLAKHHCPDVNPLNCD